MRQIKFRGQRIDTKEWVYGTPYYLNIIEDEPEDCVHKACIITGVDWDGLCGFMSPDNNSFVEVIPESVGQFTGLKDKNGNKVYEGDIVKVKGTKKTLFYDTEIIHNGLGFMLKENKTYLKDYKMVSSMIEIIGNIHETKNL